MLAALPIVFERPQWLFLLLLIIPCFWMARRSIGGLSRSKATLTFALRVIVILLLATALAEPIWEKRGKGLTVSVLLDRSQSVPLPLKASSVTFLEKARAASKDKSEDRVAVVSIAKEANIVAMPDSYSAVTPGPDDGDLTATNLAAGLHMALAIMPDDTANRILLASDGNETVDSVMAAAELAKANRVPIDVVVLEYEHRNEVIFERIIAPARARQGQSANIKLVLRTQSDTTGTIHLKMNGEPVDLDPAAEGSGMRVELKAGPASVFPVTLSLDSPGPQQFDAIFEPDNVADDEIDRNNSAVAVTFVGGEGKVLIVDDGQTESEYLIRALQQSNISIDVRAPGEVTSAVMLAGYDAVVIANVPRHSFDDDQDKVLHAYVHDLGGGLVMIGGDQSFGAGGWIGSEVAKVLPVKLDPPQTRQMVRGALALIMHSCEMPQGNYWGQKVAISAIEALSSMDYVGITVYGWGAPAAGPNINGAVWAFPMSIAGDKSAAIAAAKQMSVGDMPDFDASMQLAFNGLMSVSAGQRHAIIISDGDPSAPSQTLLNQYAAQKITCSTVLVAGHGFSGTMRNVANATGGTFYEVKNPKNLPQIFIKEAQIVSRSLIQEGDVYQPRVASSLPGPTEGFSAVPSIDGYVLTAPREGLAQIPIVNDTSEGADPIYAFWNDGLGKSIAYTSDLTGRWGARWASWEQFRAFWEQSIRWAMRPSSPTNLIVNTKQEGDRAIVEVEALDANASFLNFMQTSAVVLHPDSEAEPLSLQQIGPGRYRGEFRAAEPGAHLINVSYAAGGSAQTAVRGNLQAAVSVPYAPEFKAVKHNAALLQQLADATGGRVLAADSPEALNLFESEGLEIPKSPREIWDLLAIIAAALFVFDVAARRISVDPRWVAALAGRAVGKRADATTETVAAWKRTKTQATQRKRIVKPVVDRSADRSVKFEASQDDAKLAIDVGAEIPADMRAKPQAMPAAQPKVEKAEDEGDYTSRLLAAKRRARGEDGDQNPSTGS